jgi:hypothetical protein
MYLREKGSKCSSNPRNWEHTSKPTEQQRRPGKIIPPADYSHLHPTKFQGTTEDHESIGCYFHDDWVITPALSSATQSLVYKIQPRSNRKAGWGASLSRTQVQRANCREGVDIIKPMISRHQSPPMARYDDHGYLIPESQATARGTAEGRFTSFTLLIPTIIPQVAVSKSHFRLSG